MPVARHRRCDPLSPYASVRRLSAPLERAAASEAVERMVYAGMSYAAAAAAARRGLRLAAVAAPTQGRTD